MIVNDFFPQDKWFVCPSHVVIYHLPVAAEVSH